MSRKGSTLLALVAVLGVGMAILATSCWLNGGMFTYSLDDAYIHLALSEQLARGHFGIEPLTASAPSSSILWPLLLAPFAAFPIHEFVPLALNVLGLGWAVVVAGRVVDDALPRDLVHRNRWRTAAMVAPALGLNWLATVFTGMEATWQTALTVTVGHALFHATPGRRLPRHLGPAMIVLALLRYESVLFVLGACIVLWRRRQRRTAALVATTTAVLVAAYSAFLHCSGLPLLPASVLSKSALFGTSIGAAVVGQTLRSLGNVQGAILLALLPLLGWLAMAKRERPHRDMVVLTMVVLAGQLLGGRVGGNGRYETHALALASVVLVRTLPETVGAIGCRGSRRRIAWLTAAGAFLVASPYLVRLVLTPVGCHDIYQQHTQVHRFVTLHHRGPIGVNDLGRISYRNPYPVLDFYGLGSEEARRLRATNRPGWMEDLARRHGVPLLVVYEDFFGSAIPSSWIRVATMRSSGLRLSAARDTVTFFAVDEVAADHARRSLRAFAPNLPPDVVLAVAPPKSIR